MESFHERIEESVRKEEKSNIGRLGMSQASCS